QDRIVRAAHAHVGDVGAAARQDARVGGGHMRVRAEDDRSAAVEPVAHGDLFAGGLGVKIADAAADVSGDLGQDAIGGGEGVVGGEVHVNPPQQRENAHRH